MSIIQKTALILGDSTEYFEINIRSNKSSKFKQKKFAMKVLSETLEIEFSDEWLNTMNLNPKKDSFIKAIDIKISAEDLALTIINYRHKETKKYGKNDYFQNLNSYSEPTKNNKTLRYKDLFNNYLSILPEDKHFGFELGDRGYKPKNEVLDLYFDKFTESVFKLNWQESGIQITESKLQLANEYLFNNVSYKRLHHIVDNVVDDISKFYSLSWISRDRSTFFNGFDKFKESLSTKTPFQALNHSNQFVKYTNLYSKVENNSYQKNNNCNLLIHYVETTNEGHFVYVYKKSDVIKTYIKFKKANDLSKALIKMEFTKYINDYYLNIPDYDIEQFKRTCENGIAVEYKIVTGRQIEHVYSTSNVYKQTGSLGNSCMNNGKQCSNERTKKTDFYCENENISIIAGYVIGTEVLVSRALLWTTVDGIKVMDRVYSIDEATTMHMAEWAKTKEFLNIYDYRTFDGTGRGTYYNTAPGNWRNEYDRDFVVQLTAPIVNDTALNMIKDTYEESSNTKRIISTVAGKLPYLDNFNVFNLEKNLVSNSTSILQGLIVEKKKVIAIDGNYYPEGEVVMGFTGEYISENSHDVLEISVIDQGHSWNNFVVPSYDLGNNFNKYIIGTTGRNLYINRTNQGTNISQFTDLVLFNSTVVDFLISRLNKITESTIEDLYGYFAIIEQSIYNNSAIGSYISTENDEEISIDKVIDVVKKNLDILNERFKELNNKKSLMDALSGENIIGYRKGRKQEENESLEIVD